MNSRPPTPPDFPLAITVAVVMRKERIRSEFSRWKEWRWLLDDVICGQTGFGSKPRLLYQDEQSVRWLHPGMPVELHRDDAEGYYLNVTTDVPSWFVMWRMEEEPMHADEPIAMPQLVTLSYYDAGRLLDAQETVELVPAPAQICQWVSAFVDAHYVPEPKRRRRPVSFEALQDRFGNPASVTTLKKFGGHQGG